MIQRYLLDNTHRCRLEMVPDAGVEEEEDAEEEARLAEIKKGLSQEQEQALVEEARELAAFQKEQEGANLEVLPKVTLAQVPKGATEYPLKVEACGPVQVHHHTCFTNDIVYAQLEFDLPPLTEEELPYLRLLGGMLAELGCGGRSYLDNLAYIQEHTGGVGAGLALNVAVEGLDTMHPQIGVGGKALGRKVDKFFPLLQEMASSADFTDVKRVNELLMQHASGLESNLVRHAMNYATTLAGSCFSAAGRIQQSWYGTDYLHFIRSLVEDPRHLPDRLIALQERLFLWKTPPRSGMWRGAATGAL